MRLKRFSSKVFSYAFKECGHEIYLYSTRGLIMFSNLGKISQLAVLGTYYFNLETAIEYMYVNIFGILVYIVQYVSKMAS